MKNLLLSLVSLLILSSTALADIPDTFSLCVDNQLGTTVPKTAETYLNTNLLMCMDSECSPFGISYSLGTLNAQPAKAKECLTITSTMLQPNSQHGFYAQFNVSNLLNEGEPRTVSCIVDLQTITSFATAVITETDKALVCKIQKK